MASFDTGSDPLGVAEIDFVRACPVLSTGIPYNLLHPMTDRHRFTSGKHIRLPN